MIARPALTALGCRSCQHAIYRAVLCSSAPAPAVRSLTSCPRKQLAPVARRAFSTEQKDVSSGLQNDYAEEEPSGEREQTPWFLEEEPPRHPPSQHKPDLPKVPENAPAMLEPMIKYVYEDMGLDDLSMLDLRDLDPPASLGHNLIMLFGTARSERHLHVSAGRFVRWLRRNYNVGARAEGLIGPGELKTKLRRLRKKAKLMGSNTAMLPGGDLGISTGWVCVNFRSSGDDSAESVSFDESGRFSGFGASATGTTVVVQCMTEARRGGLDLETLWKGILKRNLDQQSKIRGEEADAEKLDELLASKLQLHSSPPASQWDAMKRSSQQHRYFSTTARRLRPAEPAGPGLTSSPRKSSSLEQEREHNPETESVRRDVLDVQLGGSPMDQERLEHLISQVLGAPSTANMKGTDRIALVDQLLCTGEERGLVVRSREMLVTLIESVVTSPAYGPELGRAQKNFEMLLAEMHTPLGVDEVARLMNAHAYRKDWDRFWDVFRSLSRFNMARSPQLYDLAFRTVAASKDSKLCAEALRWVYPEMLMEKPPVKPIGTVYRSLKSCILVADPSAEELLHNPPPPRDMTELERRRLKRREFVKVLREVEALRMSVRHSPSPPAKHQNMGSASPDE